jgi:vesicle coat complex subunit
VIKIIGFFVLPFNTENYIFILILMSFYELNKDEREKLVNKIKLDILSDLQSGRNNNIVKYFSDDDTYIRKTAYLAVGRIYFSEPALQNKIIFILHDLLNSNEPKIRQTVINSAGEIGMKDFNCVEHLLDTGLTDEHHSVRNAVIGSLKKMSEKNPKPSLEWAKKYLHHPDKEIRREVCHGIELRGRTHPQDVLPLLKELQNDTESRVKSTLIHVIGQIAYKKGCLEIVINELNTWENKELVEKALDEIINVHERYKNFSSLSRKQAISFIRKNYKKR